MERQDGESLNCENTGSLTHKNSQYLFLDWDIDENGFKVVLKLRRGQQVVPKVGQLETKIAAAPYKHSVDCSRVKIKFMCCALY